MNKDKLEIEAELSGDATEVLLMCPYCTTTSAVPIETFPGEHLEFECFACGVESTYKKDLN